MSISVALATFNAEKNLGMQLQSIAEQTQVPFEMVICDDGSQDRTAEIVNAFARQAPFAVKFAVNTSRLGWKQNFAQAALRCSGDLITFCDQDDFWLPGKLEVLSRTMAAEKLDAVVHRDALLFDSNVKIDGTKPSGKLKEFAKSAVFYGGFDGHRLIFRRRLLPWLELQSHFADWLFPGEIAHDRLIMLGALTGRGVGYLDTILTLFRRHSGQVTSGTEKPSIGSDYLNRAEVVEGWIDGISNSTSKLATEAEVAAMRTVLERLASSLRVRAELYSEERLRGRLQKMLRLIALGAYGARDVGALGPRSFLKDANCVVTGY